MVRNYVKKRTKTEFNEDDMLKAIESVKKKDLSLRKAADVYGLTHTALFYRIKKLEDNAVVPNPHENFSSKHTFRQVFHNEQEELLKAYVLKCAQMNYGLTYKILRTLAFEYALK